MRWVDTVRATALAALAERKAPASGAFDKPAADLTASNAWLARVSQTHARNPAPAVIDPATPCRDGDPQRN